MRISSKWKDEYLFYIYDLIKDGHPGSEIARILGVSSGTYESWKKKNPILHIAIACGKRVAGIKESRTPTFKRYVFGRLPKKLQRLWTKIDAIDLSRGECRTGYETTIRVFAGKSKRVRQRLFLYAWTQSNFSISVALRKVCVSRATFEKWKQEPEFQDLVQEIEWHRKNFFEDALTNLVQLGDSSATIFANKTQNADRGYNDKSTVEHKHSGSIDVNIIDIDKLGLPLNIRKTILQAWRASKLVESKVVPALPGSKADNIEVPMVVNAEKVEAQTEEGKDE
jgi:transposase